MNRRYLINLRTKEVHDLWNRKDDCQINEIVNYEYLDFVSEHNLEVWILGHSPEYDGCKHCLEKFHRK